MDAEPPAYVVDTSAWADLRDVTAVPGVWGRLDGLVAAGRLIIPQEVVVELRNGNHALDDWVRKQSGCHWSTVDLWPMASTIADRYPDLVDYAKFKAVSGADPFVVAAAIIERDKHVFMPREAIVVTNEVEHGPGRIAIPDACKAEHIECLNIEQWFTREGWGV
jgi:Domain of unknown function (DUF4411)